LLNRVVVMAVMPMASSSVGGVGGENDGGGDGGQPEDANPKDARGG